MNKKHTGLVFGTALTVCALSSAANASLIDVGNGLIYDDALNITWLQNANLAATETFGVAGVDDDGGMSWDTAKLWIAAMNDANYLGHSNWRLPKVTSLADKFDYTVKYDGSADRGYNINAPGGASEGAVSNELSHLFHNSLDNKGYCDPDSADACVSPTPDNYWAWGLRNTGPFTNLSAERYWTGVENGTDLRRAFDFDFVFGQVGTGLKDGTFLTFAVLEGNVSTVPVPAAVWLFGSGLLGLVAVGRSRRVR